MWLRPAALMLAPGNPPPTRQPANPSCSLCATSTVPHILCMQGGHCAFCRGCTFAAFGNRPSMCRARLPSGRPACVEGKLCWSWCGGVGVCRFRCLWCCWEPYAYDRPPHAMPTAAADATGHRHTGDAAAVPQPHAHATASIH